MLTTTIKVCPQCGLDYRREFTTCTNCGVPLTETTQTTGSKAEDRRHNRATLGLVMMIAAVILYAVSSGTSTPWLDDRTKAELHVFGLFPLFMIGLTFWRMRNDKPKSKRKQRGPKRLRT